ncbi:MAG: MFS transporter [Pseudomonadota bacterium]
MTDALATADPARRRGLVGAIACVGVFGASATLSFTLIGLTLEAQGVDGLWIGVNTAMASLAMLFGAPLAPRLMARIGVAAFLGVCLIAAAVWLPLFYLFDDYWWRLVARLALGIATAGLFFGSEFWIVSSAPPARRGRVVALYAAALSLGFASGPALLALIGTEGWTPWLIGAAICLAALLPLAAGADGAPQADEGEARPIREDLFLLWRFAGRAPSLIWAVALFGAVEFGAIGLVPVWGVRLDMTEDMALTLAAAIAFGGLVFQPLLGWAADRTPERPLLLACGVYCVLVAALAPALVGSPTALTVLFLSWGGVAAGLYTISLTALGGRYQGAELAAANAAMVSAYGLGALVGPPAVGVAMDVLGPHGLSVVLAAGALAYSALAARRLTMAPRPRI